MLPPCIEARMWLPTLICLDWSDILHHIQLRVYCRCRDFPLRSRWCTCLASWALCCANCGKNFEHSKINDTLANFFLAEKPEFPPNGLTFECPNCKKKVTYRWGDLVYQP